MERVEEIVAIALPVSGLGATGKTRALLMISMIAAVVVIATMTVPGSAEWGKAEEKRGPWCGEGTV